MYIVTAPFDLDQALAKIAELLALGDSPDHLANLLCLTRDLADVRQGVQPASFKRMLTDVGRLQKYIGLQEQTEKLKTDQSMLRFLGSGFKEKQLAKLDGEREKFGSLIAGPKWFYAQPRVRLLSAIRDYGLDHSQQGRCRLGRSRSEQSCLSDLHTFRAGRPGRDADPDRGDREAITGDRAALSLGEFRGPSFDQLRFRARRRDVLFPDARAGGLDSPREPSLALS